MPLDHSHHRLSGPDIRELMRMHHKTIRGLAIEFQITQKRVREVRAKGVAGFTASGWHHMITGVWLEPR